MQGLARPGQLLVERKELRDGAEITDSSTDPASVAAIHPWFDARLADHGPDGMPGHHHGRMDDRDKS
jgi:hypothetical protein